MFTGLFRSKHTSTRIEKITELKHVLHLIDKLHKKEIELRKSARSNGPNSIDQQKYMVISLLLEQIDLIINEFNTGKADTQQQELSQLVSVVHKLFTLITNTRRMDDNTLMMIRNKNREIAKDIVYGGTFAVAFATGSALLFTPVGKIASLVYVAPLATQKMGEITGLNDLSPESMRIINKLYKELSELDQQYIRKFYNNSPIKNDEDEEINDFLCPITQLVMRDPVVCSLDGKSYERAAIERWFKIKPTCPSNNLRIPAGKLPKDILSSNRNLKSVIEKFLSKNPAEGEENLVTEQKPLMVTLPG